MAKVGIFYGSDTGHTEQAAQIMQSLFGEATADCFDVRNLKDLSILNNYELLIFGTSTWYLGELQSDMEDFKDKIADLDFSGKQLALFGLGDQIEYADYYLDGMGLLYYFFKDKGVKIIGAWSVEGYNFGSYLALGDNTDKFVGLALDEDNQAEESPSRIAAWVEQLKKEAKL